MAGERALPGLGINAYWTLGSNGYRTQLCDGLRALSSLTQPRAVSRTTALPTRASGNDEAIYIVPSAAGSNANEIALADFDTDDTTRVWVYIVPTEGYFFYVVDDDEFVVFDETDWVEMVPAATTPAMDDLTDVNAPTPSDGDVLKWNDSAEEWQPAAEAGGSSGASVNAQTGTSYTLAIGDANDIITMNNAGANTINVPLNATVAFPVGTVISIIQLGAGATTVDAATGVTMNGVNGGAATVSAQHDAVSLVKIATDVWNIAGAHGGVA